MCQENLRKRSPHHLILCRQVSIDCCVVFYVVAFMLSLYSCVHHLCDQKKVHLLLQKSKFIRESPFLEAVEITFNLFILNKCFVMSCRLS